MNAIKNLVGIILVAIFATGCASQVGAIVGQSVWGSEYLIIGKSEKGLDGFVLSAQKRNGQILEADNSAMKVSISDFFSKQEIAITVDGKMIKILARVKVGSFAIPQRSLVESFAKDSGVVIDFAGKPEEIKKTNKCLFRTLMGICCHGGFLFCLEGASERIIM